MTNIRPMLGWRCGIFIVLALMLSACAGSGDRDRMGAVSRAPLPPADYLTESDQFAELQQAALAADYDAFATHLHASNRQAVISQLQDAFGGAPFDLYTLDTRTSSRDHRRVAELRGPSGRLYLYLELDRSEGGWNVERYELGRERETVLARL